MPSKSVVVIVSGMSGSGKTTALRAFEDRGFFCTDNMPLPLIPQFIEELLPMLSGTPSIALGVDIRERAFLDHLSDVLEKLEALCSSLQVVYLESSEEVLMRRFSESRRPHPLMEELADIHSALQLERKALSGLRDRATTTIDTSAFTVHQLKGAIFRFVDTMAGTRELAVQVMSFGFKHGIPLEADLVFDVRFLPNPHFVEDLRPHTGRDKAVSDYVFSHGAAEIYYEKLHDLVATALPGFRDEGKAYLTIALGCTGGKHRSVAFAERLFGNLEHHEHPRLNVHLRHRDIEKE